MIQETKTGTCTKCKSTNLVRNGRTGGGKQKFHCKDCGAYGSLDPTYSPYTEERKEEIINAYHERQSMRGIQRVFGVARETLSGWLRKKADRLPPQEEQLLPPVAEDVLELDEAWSFIGCKDDDIWLWTALCRRTRQIVGWFLGDRTAESADEFRKCIDIRA
jgi:transposase-like protein